MHRIGIDAAQFGAALEGITSLFTHEERKVLRTGLPYTEAMGEKMISHVIMSAQSMFMRHPAVSKMPNGAEASNTYIFRMALCMHVWGHRWISVGGAGKTKVEKIRNDLIDVSFAAYATFFDGILTSDKRVKYIYGVAASLLKNVCVASAR